MLRERIQSSNYSFLDKLRSIDYLLILLIIAIGSISVFAIYSTEGGNFSFYTKNHIIRLSVFFSLFLVLSFVSCLLYTSPSPRDTERSRMPSSA